jgi:hypothetical protein
MQTAFDRFLRLFGRGRAFVGDGYHFVGPSHRIHFRVKETKREENEIGHA